MTDRGLCFYGSISQRFTFGATKLMAIKKPVTFYMEDRPIKEIAQITGMPAGTVKSHIARAKVKMAKVLEN